MTTDKATGAPPRRYLVHDEIERLPSKKGTLYAFRIRVWRAKDCTPVVLVSQVPGGVPPHWLVNKAANYCFATLLGFPEEGMLYFEDEDHNGTGVLQQSFFEFFGQHQRMRLFKPSTRNTSWAFLEHAVGEQIPR